MAQIHMVIVSYTLSDSKAVHLVCCEAYVIMVIVDARLVRSLYAEKRISSADLHFQNFIRFLTSKTVS